MANPRRRSNSSSLTSGVKPVKSKFDENELEVVFDPAEMGPQEEPQALEHQSTTSSDNSHESVEEEEA